MKTEKVYSKLASIVTARLNCIKANNTEWLARHTQTILDIMYHQMPYGSGIDCGTKIDLDASRPERLVFTMSYHHMDENGYYDGWTEHSVIVTPSLAFGFNLKISGTDRNSIKEYLHEVYSFALDAECKTVKPEASRV